ncbi:FR47-like protein [Duganella sp. CF458]|uniref:GNAT family N-acetyltransferase n=1 Tax=Duganella sp. CF458 TaxID=1884368 RepID=UPI0008E28AF4|nr:GNAT family N-acetyltransferase [Duganella sp. CF458]SFF84596.1 FR47-like protein [Duganella sp. CF458]
MQELENPIWAALTSAQQHFSIPTGAARRYPAAVAPFIAVAEQGVALSAADLDGVGEGYYFLGAMPALPQGWSLQPLSGVLQMVYEGGLLVAPDAEAIRVLAADDPAMVALTDIAFPGYFRPRTGEMGRYAGIHDDGGRLVALSGERMDLGHLREVSAVCTHPDFTGRGYARQLVEFIMHGMQQQGVRPMLHVGAANARAQALYRSMGFAATRELPHARLICPG